MQTSYLKILHFLGETGYYARTEAELAILQNLVEKGYAQIKNGTKKVYKLTSEGLNYLDCELNPNTSISDKEFLSCIKEAYKELANPMKPLVKIPDIRKRLREKKVPDKLFDNRMLNLHDAGIITLQTALSKSHAVHGGIESNSGTGVFYFMMFEA
ncbi:MAG: hypothetical protein ACFFAU_08620 [Candidatus Hodarchaeota archaeon]